MQQMNLDGYQPKYGQDPAVFNKMYNHILTDKGLELFDNDWKSVQKLGA